MATATKQMNYLSLADWIEQVAERELLGSPWIKGSSARGIGAVLDVDCELAHAIHQVGAKCDWFTRSTWITVFLGYLRSNPRLEVRIPDAD